MQDNNKPEPKYECTLCGKKSNPEATNQKRSMSMHVSKEHKVKGNASDYWREIEEEPAIDSLDSKAEKTEKGKPISEKTPIEQREIPSENYIYLVQARFDSPIEAESEAETFTRQRPDLEDFTYLRQNYMFVKCSTGEKAEEVKRMIAQYLNPVEVTIQQEVGEINSGRGTFSKLANKLTQFNPLASSPQTQRTQPTSNPSSPVSSAKTPEPEVIGHTVPVDNYKHYQMTEADPSDMEGLMNVRQQIAKGEGIGGRDWGKIAGAIAVVLITLGIFYIMIQSGGGGGGGGGGIPIPGIGTIP